MVLLYPGLYKIGVLTKLNNISELLRMDNINFLIGRVFLFNLCYLRLLRTIHNLQFCIYIIAILIHDHFIYTLFPGDSFLFLSEILKIKVILDISIQFKQKNRKSQMSP